MIQSVLIVFAFAGLVALGKANSDMNRLDAAVSAFNESNEGMEFDVSEFCNSAELSKGHEVACENI